MTREELEKNAIGLYTKDEIKLLLRGFDIGMAHATKIMYKAITEKENKLQ